jgi:hypothetical protein
MFNKIKKSFINIQTVELLLDYNANSNIIIENKIKYKNIEKYLPNYPNKLYNLFVI